MKAIFVDSSVFLKILEGDNDARNLFESISEEASLYRNSVVFSEVIYIWLRLSTNLPINKLKRTEFPSQELDDVVALLNLAEPLPLTSEIEETALQLMKTYSLLPNDALIASTCKHNGIQLIATYDSDFSRVPFLKVLTPENPF